MGLRNNANKFGSLTKFLHWSVFALFIVQYFLVYRREYFPKGSDEKLQYILLHKSLGVLLLGVAIFMIIWRHLGQRPAFPQNMSSFQRLLARVIHLALYLTMLAMPLTGIAMSQLGGRSVQFFGVTLPQFFALNKPLASVAYNVHLWTSYTLYGIVGLHIVGALVHHWVYKDNVLTRMLPGDRH